MKDKRKVEILLKVIERVYNKNPDTEKLIDESMIHVCKEEGVSPEQVFFVFAFLYCWLYRYGLSKHKFSVCKGKQLMKIIRFIFSLRFIFSGDHSCRIL